MDVVTEVKSGLISFSTNEVNGIRANKINKDDGVEVGVFFINVNPITLPIQVNNIPIGAAITIQINPSIAKAISASVNIPKH